jgi:hypothetical protein
MAYFWAEDGWGTSREARQIAKELHKAYEFGDTAAIERLTKRANELQAEETGGQSGGGRSSDASNE